jgi:hypothetical protein
MCGCFRLTTLTVHLRHGRHTNGIPSLAGGMSVSVIHVYLLIMSLYSASKRVGEESLIVWGGGVVSGEETSLNFACYEQWTC